MSKIAQANFVSATPFPAAWPLRSAENGDQPAFLIGMKERAAALSVHPKCPAAHTTDRAVPLPSDADSRIAERDPAPAVPGLLFESLGLMLYTAEGHMRPLVKIEADLIRLAVQHYDGRMSEVARRLNISRSTLYRKLDAYGIVYTRE